MGKIITFVGVTWAILTYLLGLVTMCGISTGYAVLAVSIPPVSLLYGFIIQCIAGYAIISSLI